MYISFLKLQEICLNLADQIQKENDIQKFNWIVIITAWWFIPAYIIGKKLDIKVYETINIKSYSKDKKQKKLKFFWSEKRFPWKWILIDDLIDSGETFKAALSCFIQPELVMKVALFSKKDASIQPDYSYDIFNEWIDFFYEKPNN